MHSLYPLPKDKYIKDQVVQQKFNPDEFLDDLSKHWKPNKTTDQQPYRNPSPPDTRFSIHAPDTPKKP